MEPGCRAPAAEVNNGNDVDENSDNKCDDDEGDSRDVVICSLPHQLIPTCLEPY